MLSLFLGRLRCFFVFCPASFCCFVVFIFYPVNFCYFIDALLFFLFSTLSLFRFLSSFCPVFFLSVFLRDTATSNGLRRSTFRRFLYLREKIKRKNFDYRREKLFLRYVISKILVIFRGFAVLKSHKFESLFGGHLFRVFFRLSYAFADAIGV